MHTRLPAAVGEDPARRGVGVVDDAASRGESRRHARLDVLASDGHVDVHRVPERLVRVELLHPDRRAVAERVDGVVVGQRCVPEDSAPEADIDRVGLRSDRQLDLLRTCAVGDGTVRPRDRRDRPRRSMCRSSSRNTPRRQPHAETVVGDRQQSPRALEAGHAARPPRQAAPLRRATGRGTRQSRRRAAPPSRSSTPKPTTEHGHHPRASRQPRTTWMLNSRRAD